VGTEAKEDRRSKGQLEEARRRSQGTQGVDEGGRDEAQ
jgi:hypothetical protein